MKNFLILMFCLTQGSLIAQNLISPCAHESIVKRHLETNPHFETELSQTEDQLQRIIKDLKTGQLQRKTNSFVIPVVMHVFHLGEDGKMGLEQALSGLEILNQDFKGLNDGWNTIDPAFDGIKGTLNITFCLAQIDPLGNPTTGILYHQDERGIKNEGDIFRHAWDNFKYLNIYFPKHIRGEPSDFSGYAYYPSSAHSNSNSGGVVFGSVRWGFGEHSIMKGTTGPLYVHMN